MKRLPRPSNSDGTPMVAGDVYDLCVSMVDSDELRERLIAIRPQVVASSIEYDSHGDVRHHFRHAVHDFVGAVTCDELKKVYTQRMVPKKSKGRRIYDRIISIPAHRRCPFCGIGTVNTLDHYLPKTWFPIFSVTPNNLVPSCQWCQGEKLESYPKTEEEQLIHPYFDTEFGDQWLAAKVIEGSPAAFHFFADPPAGWDEAKKTRADNHLFILNLPELFASNAGSRLAEIRGNLATLHAAGGEAAVRSYLDEAKVSAELDDTNSWAAAMYRAAVGSAWFCNGGFAIN